MSYQEFLQETGLDGHVLAVTLVSVPEEAGNAVPGCVYNAIRRVFRGETCLLTGTSCGCGGFPPNAGLSDDLPPIPGGFGAFLSRGAGEGFPPGARLKCSPAVAEAHFHSMPKDVMAGCNAFRLEPYREELTPDLVLCFATPDQLSPLLFLHGYCQPAYDNLLAGTAAGCASLFRIPLGQRKLPQPKAVLGNLDLSERCLLDETLLSFAVSGEDFSTMLSHTDTCFFHSPMWTPLRRRIHRP